MTARSSVQQTLLFYHLWFPQLSSGRSRLCDFTDCFFPSHNSLVEDRGYATSLPQSQLTDCSLVEDRGYATSLPQSLTGIYCYLIYFPSKCGQIGYDRCTLDLWTLGQERCTFPPPYWTYWLTADRPQMQLLLWGFYCFTFITSCPRPVDISILLTLPATSGSFIIAYKVCNALSLIFTHWTRTLHVCKASTYI